ncbi:MAG: hypothetical protein JW963_05355 [Anaerolineales bacterium]|nr:hypothetical protein [Anaerolineales bacterium]
MQLQWSDLMLIIIGGVIGIVGSLVTTIVNNNFTMKKARREILLAAYVEWAQALHHAIDEAERLWVFDDIEKIKKKDLSGKLKDIPSSPSGKTREEQVKDYQSAMDTLHATQARVLLVERNSRLRAEIEDVSNLHPMLQWENENVTVVNITKYADEIREKIKIILRSIEV